MRTDAQQTPLGGATAGKKRSAIERIRRLEQLERARLEARERTDRRLSDAVAAARPSGGRHDLCDRIEAVMKYPMALVAVAWLVIVVAVVAASTAGPVSVVLVGSLFALWAVMLAEYVVRLIVTPDTRGYLSRRWAEPATVVVPPLQGWHFVGIEKFTLLVHEAQLRVEAVLRHHSLFRVLIAALATLLVGAWLVLLFEQHTAGSKIHSYREALWWAMVTVTTVGYGDYFPTSGGGQIVAVVLMLLGISLIGVLTATIASVFVREHVREHTDSTRDQYQKNHADLGQQLLVISARLADIERRLGATPAEVAAASATRGAAAEAGDGAAGTDAAAGGTTEPKQSAPSGGEAYYPSHEGHPYPGRRGQ